jgi:bacterioferritin (cytochrome b1)
MKEETKQDEKKSARRQLIGTGALAAAGALLAGFAAACSDDEESDDKPGPSGPDGGTDAGTLDASRDATTPVDAGTLDADVAILNGLLSAEYSAIAAYTAGGPIVMGAATTDPLYALRTTIVAIATNIAGQHALHAAALVDSIKALGGTPVAQSSITFAPPKGLTDNLTIRNVLKFATGAERGAAVAYNKAVEKLEAAKHRYIATAIEGDETQHFIILAALVLGLADPGPSLNDTKGGQVPPKAFVRTVGTQQGLETLTAYFPAS